MDNASVADMMIRGATIPMGDGSKFDYLDPYSTTMTIEDYAYALAYASRWNGQTRCHALGGRRCFFSVAQHCTIIAQQLMDDGYGAHAFDGLMHEPGEVTCGDGSAPMKRVCPEFKTLEKFCGEGIGARFGVPNKDPILIKRYDLRMLATEYRDLIYRGDLEYSLKTPPVGYEPFDQVIVPYQHPDQAARRFMQMYAQLAPSEGLGK